MVEDMVDWKRIEEKWQRKWAEAKAFEADPDPERPKYYLTVAYPYPNSPQHIGHGRTYTLTDVHARYRRMQGYNVLLPMAWHLTGTPVIAMVNRLKEGDADLIHTFLDLYKIPKERLSELETPMGPRSDPCIFSRSPVNQIVPALLAQRGMIRNLISGKPCSACQLLGDVVER